MPVALCVRWRACSDLAGTWVIGELGGYSLWAAKRRISGWLGSEVWRTARFHTAAELKRLALDAGLEVTASRGAIFYPPCAAAAALLAPCDAWLGRRTTTGAAFVAVVGRKPSLRDTVVTGHR